MNWKFFTVGVVTVVTVFSFMHYNAFFLEDASGINYIVQHLANAVGVSVGVEENQYNLVAKQLEERALELENQEASLRDLEREIVEQISENKRYERRAFLYATAVGSVVLFLLLLNFYFDMKWRKKKKNKYFSN
jgi:hypothetical protein